MDKDKMDKVKDKKYCDGGSCCSRKCNANDIFISSCESGLQCGNCGLEIKPRKPRKPKQEIIDNMKD